MRLQDVDLPDGLLEAQEKGSLVIFAGAGMSIPAPSNYPDFEELAEELSGGALTRQEKEPIDRFLGRLVKHGVHVHELVRKKLSNPHSTPNPLHKNLLRLFKSAQKVKIVTTNFDLHFTVAAGSVFEDFGQIEIHSAPALPLGGSFTGLVYLHGNVEKPEERLVLTDADFGRAYLTEGWARRFLQGLFSASTVLFAGYSHSDPVMNYLARGLPPQSGLPRRFALTPEKNRETWEFLGVTPIIYPIEEGDKKHAAVGACIATWADRVAMGVLEQEDHIRQIVGKLPTNASPEGSDYLLRALRNPSTARFFTRYATDPDWLRWVENAGHLKRLFVSNSRPDDTDLVFAEWFAERFVCEHPGDALAVVQRQGQLLGEALWTAVALRLFRKKDPPPEPRVFSRWVPVLLHSANPGRTRDLLDYILVRQKSPEHDTTALLLFQYLTAPRVVLKKDSWIEIKRKEGEQPPDDVTVELTAEGDDYWLNDSWHRVFRPRLERFAENLVPIITSHLQNAHYLLKAFDKVDETWDSLSSHRNVIENAGSLRDFSDTLVDAGRDVMDLYATKNPRRADALIEVWLSSDCRLLRRLAVYGVGKHSDWSPDEKVEWIARNNLVYAPGLQHEVSMSLQSSYSSASEEARTLLLDQVEKGPMSDADPRQKAYQTYNLLHWLHESFPSCTLTRTRLDKIEADYPEFKPREPDLDGVIERRVHPKDQSPVTADDLIAKSPEEQIEFLLSYNPEYSPIGPSRDDLLRTAAVAAGRSFPWGLDLARSIEARGMWESDLWPSIVEAWNSRGLSEAEWTEVLEFLRNRPLKSAAYQVATLLENGIGKTDYAIPTSGLQLSFQVSRTLWDVISGFSETSREKAEDWLMVAINHPAGITAEFWLRFISRLRNRDGEQWVGLPEDVKELFTEIISGETYAADLARVVFVSNLHFWFSADKQWASTRILPLLDPTANPRRALQCWHGYLWWGRWPESLLPSLLPLYEKLFLVIGSEGERLQRRFCEHLASIACESSINPVQHGWLTRFLHSVEPEIRRKFTGSIRPILKGLEKAKKQEAWLNWIAQYWQGRIEGIPIPLDPVESGEMVEWCLNLEPVFPEVVDKISNSPPPQLEHSFIYYELPETELPKIYPTPVARLLLDLLRRSSAPIYDYDRIDKVFDQLILGNVDRRTLLDICDTLAAQGYDGASRLKNLIPVPEQQEKA